MTVEGGGDFGNSADYETVFNVANAGPTGTPDSATVKQNSPQIATEQSVLIPVLSNDSDPNGDGLSIDVGSVTDPANGTTQVQADNKIKYTPDDNFVGTDTFTYRAFDGTVASADTTVTVTVTSVACAGSNVSTPPGVIEATFERIGSVVSCKQYTLQVDPDGTVLFEPASAVAGEPSVTYRGFIELGPKPAVVTAPAGEIVLLLKYDPSGGSDFRPVPWCDNPTFNAAGIVLTATLPPPIPAYGPRAHVVHRQRVNAAIRHHSGRDHLAGVRHRRSSVPVTINRVRC